MSAKDGFEDGLMKLIFQNTDLANVGDGGGLRGSVADGDFFVALFTADPTDSTQGTETVYTNYERVAVTRTGSTGWTVSGTSPTNVSNTAAITFPQCGATGATLTGFAICTSGTEGTDDAIFWGALSSNLAVSNGITPEIAIGALDINVD